MLFANRAEAGERLADQLRRYVNDQTVILAIPRGGVEVGAVIARNLGRPLDAIITRKLGAPGNPEFAIGAIAETGDIFLNRPAIEAYGISQGFIEQEIAGLQQEIARRVAAYRDGRPLAPLRGRRVILVDDGLATGQTMLAAIQAVRSRQPEAIILAVPVAPPETIEELEALVDHVVCLATPEPFYAVGAFYRFFPDLSDESVRQALQAAQTPPPPEVQGPPIWPEQ